MEKGLNSDVRKNQTLYHVQTEDWGREKPYIVSRIFANGAIVRTVKSSYEDIGLSKGSDSMFIRMALRKQHNEILDQVDSGQLD